MLFLTYVVLDPLLRMLQGAAAIWHYAAALLILGPIGILMGLPFTIGMRDILSSTAQRAYAWASNGCASVLASIAAAQMALMFGIPYILVCALVAYGIVLLSWRQMNTA
jgi:hypothetical protein